MTRLETNTPINGINHAGFADVLAANAKLIVMLIRFREWQTDSGRRPSELQEPLTELINSALKMERQLDNLQKDL